MARLLYCSTTAYFIERTLAIIRPTPLDRPDEASIGVRPYSPLHILPRPSVHTCVRPSRKSFFPIRMKFDVQVEVGE